MSDYRMEIKGQIGLSDYSNIYDYLGIVEDDDVFTIKFARWPSLLFLLLL